MTRLLMIGLSLAAFSAPASAEPVKTVSGRARVLNGDTLVIAGKVIGLYGAAAPGQKQTCLNAKGHSYNCGATSAQALSHHLRDAVVTCQIRETDAFGRALSVCHKDKDDLGAWMIGEGHAVADRERPAYVEKELPAWGRRKGLWAGSFEDLTHRKRLDYTHQNALADVQTTDEAR